MIVAVLAAAAPGAAYSDASFPADPAEQPPFDGGRTYELVAPRSQTSPPPGFALDARRVAATAADAVSGEVAGGPRR